MKRPMTNSALPVIVATMTATVCLTGGEAVSAETPVVEWVRQWSENDLGEGLESLTGEDVAVDVSGNIYMTGTTFDWFGDELAYLLKCDSGGNRLWSRTLKSPPPSHVHGFDVAVDPLGNAAIVGETMMELDGNDITLAAHQAFITKYDTGGDKQWTRFTQFLGVNGVDACGSGVAFDDDGNSYATGFLAVDDTDTTSATYLAKYDASGIQQWFSLIPQSSGRFSADVATDSDGNSFVVDSSLSKFNTDGELLWREDVGQATPYTERAVCLDAHGNIYVAASTMYDASGGLNEDLSDIFLVKYAPNGSRLWTERLGSAENDHCMDVAADDVGNVYIVGSTAGVLDGEGNAGLEDIILAKYDSDGKRLWTEQFGTAEVDVANGVSVSPNGDIFIFGTTRGNLDGSHASVESHAFLAKITAIPEPSSVVLVLIGALGIGMWCRRR